MAENTTVERPTGWIVSDTCYRWDMRDRRNISDMSGEFVCMVPADSPFAHLIAAAPDFHEVAPEAVDLLDQYVDFIRTVKADDLDQHPYLPSVEDVVARLRAALLKASPAGEGV